MQLLGFCREMNEDNFFSEYKSNYEVFQYIYIYMSKFQKDIKLREKKLLF